MKTRTGVPGVTGTTPELPEVAVIILKEKVGYQKYPKNGPAYRNKQKKFVRKNGQK